MYNKSIIGFLILNSRGFSKAQNLFIDWLRRSSTNSVSYVFAISSGIYLSYYPGSIIMSAACLVRYGVVKIYRRLLIRHVNPAFGTNIELNR